jgi:hypothetical protein
MDLQCGLFTDQGPLLSAARTLLEKFRIKLKLQLCLQHIIRCIRAMLPKLFKKKKKLGKKDQHCQRRPQTTKSFVDLFTRLVIVKKCRSFLLQLIRW